MLNNNVSKACDHPQVKSNILNQNGLASFRDNCWYVFVICCYVGQVSHHDSMSCATWCSFLISCSMLFSFDSVFDFVFGFVFEFVRFRFRFRFRFGFRFRVYVRMRFRSDSFVIIWNGVSVCCCDVFVENRNSQKTDQQRRWRPGTPRVISGRSWVMGSHPDLIWSRFDEL